MQLDKVQIDILVDQYLTIFPEEKAELAPLFNFLETTQGDLYDRKNMDGHIVGSGVIVDPTKSESLLIFHNFFKMYQQPGGHIDPGEIPLHGAQRECEEETGIHQFTYLPIDSMHPMVPLNIGCHIVPANREKNEEEHRHFDFIYVFQTTQKNTNVDDDGVSDAKWVALDEISERLPNIPDKIRTLN